jgi:hypothetical protein
LFAVDVAGVRSVIVKSGLVRDRLEPSKDFVNQRVYNRVWLIA